jgi:hypothetical protein
MAIATIEAYLDAHNHHDLDKTMACFAEDIRFEMGDVWKKAGKGEVRKLEEWDNAVNSRLTASDMRESGDTVTCRLTESNDWYDLAGVGEVAYQRCTITVKEGKITRINTELTPESMMGVTEALKAIMEWAARERPAVLAELMPNGELVYGAQNGAKWLQMLRAWKEKSS